MRLTVLMALCCMSRLLGAEIGELQTKAAAGDPVAQFGMGQAHAAGKGVKKDLKAAVDWFTKAAGQGNTEAQLALGKLYLGGSGMPKNSTESAKWYRLAAQQGSTTAQIQLSRMYLAGAGVTKSEVEACRWAKVAFAKGDKQAKGLVDFFNQKLDQVQLAEADLLVQEIMAPVPADAPVEGVPLVIPPLEKEPE